MPLLSTTMGQLCCFQVTNTDTLASIAAQFDTTTSELKKSNRLMSDMVIPGKVISITNALHYQTVVAHATT